MVVEATPAPASGAPSAGASAAAGSAAAPEPASVTAAPAELGKTSDDVSRLSALSIRVIAQSIPNLPPLKDEAAAALAPDAEYRIREIVQDSMKFMQHARRRRLTTGDINAALRLRNVEPLYGFGQAQSKSATRAEDALTGLGAAIPAATGISTTLGISGGNCGTAGAVGMPGLAGQRPNASENKEVSVTYGRVGDASLFTGVDGVDDLYFVEDVDVNLKQLIETPLPAVPLDYAVAAHWLAIDGVQPTLPQNPLREGQSVAGRGGVGVNDAFKGMAEAGGATGKSASTTDPVVKPRVKHVLGKELQLYYEHVTAALAADNAPQRNASLMSLSEEPGLNQLLPYFTLYVRDSVHSSLKNLPFLFSLMRLSRALLTNPHFHVEPYLHQLLPPVITCLVGKRLCAKPKDDHWALRDFAAELVADICSKFGRSYTTVQPRITKTLTGALLDQSRPLTTHYGAIVGLGALGFRVVDLLLLPHIDEYSKHLLKILDETAAKQKGVRRLEAAKVYGALAWAVTVSQHCRETPTLMDDTLPIAAVPAEEIGKLLPEYGPRFRALHAAYAERFFPRSVVSDAVKVSAGLLEEATAQSKQKGT
jgi:transcription initiation factor TFIID subunit 6